MITIFKGDDTDFMGRALKLSVDTGDLNLSGCKMELSFLGITRCIDLAGAAEFILVLSAAETSALPLGVHMATLRLFDQQGRRYTLSNTVKIRVTDNVADAYETPATITDLTISIPNILSGETFDVGGTNGDVRAFLAKLAAAMGAKVVDTEGEYE